jgi:hypothetical protein
MTDKPDDDDDFRIICGHAAVLRRRTAIADALVEELFRRLLKTKYPCEPDEEVPSVPETKGDRRRRLAAELDQLAAKHPEHSVERLTLQTRARRMRGLARHADKTGCVPRSGGEHDRQT